MFSTSVPHQKPLVRLNEEKRKPAMSRASLSLNLTGAASVRSPTPFVLPALKHSAAGNVPEWQQELRIDCDGVGQPVHMQQTQDADVGGQFEVRNRLCDRLHTPSLSWSVAV